MNTIEQEPNGQLSTVIAIGDGSTRRKIAEKYPHLLYTSVNYSRYLVTPADGVIICPGTIITDNVVIGQFTVINLNCTIGHDCRIGAFVTISPGVNISGNVTIGNNCYIGSNAVLKEGISICDGVTIGAEAIVIRDINEPGTYVNDTRLRKL